MSVGMCIDYGEAFAQNRYTSFPNKYSKNKQLWVFPYFFIICFYVHLPFHVSHGRERQMKIPQFGVKMKDHKLIDHKTNLPSRYILFDKHNVSKNYLTPSIKWLGNFVKIYTGVSLENQKT